MNSARPSNEGFDFVSKMGLEGVWKGRFFGHFFRALINGTLDRDYILKVVLLP
jgi:hypothetical protein